jgi:small subunit ribosomal protein S31
MPFHEHVLLDRHLEDFPQIEVVQNFMKLVLNGLSQNAYLSVKEKRETIGWYRKFFIDHLKDLNEALEDEKKEQEFSANS